MIKEKYYGVRIGRVPLCRPYLMLGDDGKTPALCSTREAAEALALIRVGRRADCGVVAVEIREIRTRRKNHTKNGKLK